MSVCFFGARSGFSKKDVRTITYLACKQHEKPKYKIAMQTFCDKFNKIVFTLKETDNDVSIEKTAHQIVVNKELINNLSKEDLNCISYIAGYEHSHA